MHRYDPYALTGTGAGDLQLLSRALGVLFSCGGLLVLVGAALSRPEGASAAGLYGVGAMGLVLGGAAFVWVRHAHAWAAHALFAFGTGLICLGTYFAGAATGLYSALLVWLVIVAASFFSARAVAAHVVWILIASAVTLNSIDGLPGTSAATRWVIGGVLLAIAAVAMSRIAAGRRATEKQLRAEIEKRERLQRELEHLADHDPLTGVANRRRLEQELTRELVRARRERTPLCVVILDLDDLKEHNDAHGHAAGDRLLEHAASTWAAALRATDLIARIGGDEFAVLLPDCTPAVAERLMTRLCDEVAPDCRSSAGSACWDGQESADELLARADRAMYDAKAAARRQRRQPPAPRSSTPADQGCSRRPLPAG
ncbi:MAG: diguanylate cyclase [Thermoleophilaceae bacterium]